VLSYGGFMENLLAEDVRKQVRRFWDIFSGKVAGRIEEMYAPTAIAFSGRAKRSESARLIAMRRTRRIEGGVSSSSLEENSIDVQIVEPNVAIAAYTYTYQTDKVRADGTKVQLETLFGRATQIFQRDEAGVLRIVHEHLSATANPEVEKSSA
jgi:ketosteroid isomerase-like protein